MNVSHYRDELQSLMRGQKWIVVSDAIVGAHSWAAVLESMGIADLFLLGAFRGTGIVPANNPHPTAELNIKGISALDSIRRAIAAFRDLPADVKEQIDAWDPGGTAKVLGPLWDNDQPIHGRSVFGARWPQWQALEDKMICDALWDAVGIPRAPAHILPVYQDALQNSHQQLDQGLGTVWAGDNKEGWHGGAEYLRWVRSMDQISGAFPFFRSRCDRVRVQAFMEGIPCSIHGMVFPDQVIAFRPCEMLVFRTPNSNRLTYGGAATSWDPPTADRETMRAAAIRVGAHLRHQYGYRGVFTIDGIMTKDGFLPTELNPRFGAAIARMLAALPELPLYLLHRALCEGAPLAYQPEHLESLVLQAADDKRVIRAGFSVANSLVSEQTTHHYQRTEEGWQLHSSPSHASITAGPSGSGTHISLRIDPNALPAGVSAAPAVAELMRKSNPALGHGLTELEPAVDLRVQ